MPLSDRPCPLRRAASSSRAGGLRKRWGSSGDDEEVKPSLAKRSRLSLRSRCLSACLSVCRRRTASAMRSVISSSCAVPIWFRSTPSETSSSSTCLTRSSSTSSASRSDELSRERKLDWCSMALGGMTALDGDGPRELWLADGLSSRFLRDSLLASRLRSRRRRSLGVSRWLLALPGMPASLRLSCWASSSMRWSTSSRSSRRLSLGSTLSPGLYLSRSARFSSSFLPRSGLDFRNMSSSVVTVALGCVVRTEARHDGQV